MTAEGFDFGSTVTQLQDMLGGKTPSGAGDMPLWLRYVDVRAGDDIVKIVTTGLQVHAAVSGNKLYAKTFDINEVEKFKDDLGSKKLSLANIRTIYGDGCFVNRDTLIDVRFEYECSMYKGCGKYSINVITVNEETLKYIERSIELNKP